ncbi:PH domain-containing rcdII [Diplonema papillatum]|nr:PH domain-containing rcdII [Diplonema papillatum]
MFTSEDDELERLEKEATALEDEAGRLEQGVQAKLIEKQDLCSRLAVKESEVKELRTSATALQRQVEEEEEYITNGLIKRLAHLRREKEQLAKQVETEEEFLTNSLQKQLQQVSKEKLDLERHLQKEREFILTKLRAQLDQAIEQKQSLERMLVKGDQSMKLMTHLKAYKESIGEPVEAAPSDKADDEPSSKDPNSTTQPQLPAGDFAADSDTDSALSESASNLSSSAAQHNTGKSKNQAMNDTTIRKLQNEIGRLRNLCAVNENKASTNATKLDHLRREIDQLSQDNFLRDIKRNRMREELHRSKRMLASSEMVSEGEAVSGRNSRRASITSQQHNHPLKAHTEQILSLPPPSPQSTQLVCSPVAWMTPPVTPSLSPRSRTGSPFRGRVPSVVRHQQAEANNGSFGPSVADSCSSSLSGCSPSVAPRDNKWIKQPQRSSSAAPITPKRHEPPRS